MSNFIIDLIVLSIFVSSVILSLWLGRSIGDRLFKEKEFERLRRFYERR